MVNSNNSSARKGQSKTPQGTRRSSRPRTASQLRPVGNRTPTPYHHGALTPQSMERVDMRRPSSRSRPQSALSRGYSEASADLDYQHDAFMQEFTPRPSTAGTRRPASARVTSRTPNRSFRSNNNQNNQNWGGGGGGGDTTRSVGPAFVFKRAAMSHIMDWMQTSASSKDREDFQKVHSLLNIDP